MKIGLDLRMAGGGSGIDRYITELSHEILRQDKTNQYVLFFRGADKSAEFAQYNQKIVITDIPHYSFAEQLRLPGIINKENLDLVHFPHFNVPIFYRRPFIVTIHDLTHTLFPGRKRSHIFHRLAYNIVFRNALKNSKKIIAVSNATKQAIVGRFQINPEKIQVIYEGFNQAYKMMDKIEAFAQVSKSFGVTKPYILYAGVWRRYKNLPMLANAFDKLIDKGLDIELVLVGEQDPFYPEIKDQIFNIKNHTRIKVLGRVSDEDLAKLYNGTTLFVLPSLIEGFGLTALEAAACGVPVACSDIPTMREIMGQGAEYFDPNNLDNMTEVLLNLLNDAKRLEELANLALGRSKHFSWKQAAEQTISVYEKCYL
ncbi:MAG: glycosyltransferase family 1 protein [Candidatus Doudnabacteria bacterium]